MTPESERVSPRVKFFHGFGSIAYGVKENGFSTFLLLFYNQVMGMDAALVSAALALAMIIDAFADPVIGHMSDRTYTRFGRRLPWLYIAAVPLAVSWMLLWHPPGLEGWQAFAWLTLCAIFVRTLVSCCEVPSVAILPELTRDYDERTRLMRIRYVFAWLGGLIMLLLAYGVFLRAAKAGEVGQLSMQGYWNYGLTGAILIGVAVLVSALGQHKRLAHLPADRPEKTTVKEAFHEIRETVSNRAYLMLISTIVFAAISAQTTFVLSNYLYLYVWRFTDNWFTVLPLMLFATVIVAYVMVARMHIRWGKRDTAMWAILIGNAFWILPYFAYVSGLWPETGTSFSSGLALTFIFFANVCGVLVQVSLASMIADVVEASEEETGRRSEGLLYAGNLFVQKCATGVGIMVGGLIINLAGLPEKAVPGMVAQDVLTTLALAYAVVISLLAAGVVWRVRKFPISRDDHAARVRALAERAGTA